MTELEEHYNKFNEEKRLNSRHGQVEFITTMKYIHEVLEGLLNEGRTKEDIRILDLGAGTGRYSVPLSEEGYEVTAVELVKHNLGLLKAKKSQVIAKQGNAMNLKRFPVNYYDVTLIFGPMYHLFKEEERLKVLTEASRVTKENGIILVAYIMNEYSVITYAFKERHIKECLENGKLSEDYHTVSVPEDLYSYVRIEDINELLGKTSLTRIKMISADGPADYLRPFLNQMDEEEFAHFIEYHLATCERPDLMGACAHTVDILRNTRIENEVV